MGLARCYLYAWTNTRVVGRSVMYGNEFAYFISKLSPESSFVERLKIVIICFSFPRYNTHLTNCDDYLNRTMYYSLFFIDSYVVLFDLIQSKNYFVIIIFVCVSWLKTFLHRPINIFYHKHIYILSTFDYTYIGCFI